jgi:putative phosphoribosyl transferase
MKVFRDREEAGLLLGEKLSGVGLDRPVILGIPRGGIPIAVAVAHVLGTSEVAVVVARKLGAPGHQELAIGAVASTGAYYLDQSLAYAVGATDRYINEELEREKNEARRREEQFDGRRTPPLQDRNVIVVDDGVATGATAIAALRAVRDQGAKHVCFAVPVGPAAAIHELRAEADNVVFLEVPADFWAVGQFYARFEAVEDDVARKLLDSVSQEDSVPYDELRDQHALKGPEDGA